MSSATLLGKLDSLDTHVFSMTYKIILLNIKNEIYLLLKESFLQTVAAVTNNATHKGECYAEEKK